MAAKLTQKDLEKFLRLRGWAERDAPDMCPCRWFKWGDGERAFSLEEAIAREAFGG